MMESRGSLEKVDDALNAIVVKEVRQGVQSRFVVAVLLLFLLLQVVFMGIFLVVWSIGGQLESTEVPAGRTVFSVLQGLLLATFMFFFPAFTPLLLAAVPAGVSFIFFFLTTTPPP